ncbi:MAG: hypothetical protein Q6370_000900 [Candidatus Sigynarchaeota archaeon]
MERIPNSIDIDMAGRSDDLGLGRQDEKAYSTFYTEPWNAVLLASLALSLPNPSWHLDDPSFYHGFKVADFACGGGMLLLATFHALEQRARAAATREGKTFSKSAFHRVFVESSCHGFDVMEKALQMTRDVLASACPGSQPRTWNLVHAPIRPPDVLGSLDLLKDTPGTAALQRVKNNRYNLVIMNPPFARSCGDNLQFGAGTTACERRSLDKALTTIRGARGLQGIGQAGQAADFIVLAIESLEPGGRLAFIVPKSLIDGAAWLKLRRYMLDRVHVELLAFNFVPPGFSFSEHTDLSECMLVGRKRVKEQAISAERTVILNIMADLNGQADVDRLVTNALQAQAAGPARVRGDDTFAVPSDMMASHVANWQQLFGLPSRQLHDVIAGLIFRSNLAGVSLPLTRLGNLATIGPDRSELTKKTVPVKTGAKDAMDFAWGRDNDVLVSILTGANQSRAFKEHASEGIRHKFIAARSHLLLPESIFLKTTRVFGCYSRQLVLSNVSWSCKARGNDDAEKAIALWSNTTVGILLLLAVRNEARGPWIHWKKVPLQEYLVPDYAALSKPQREALAALFEQFKKRAFGTIFDDDDTRKELDTRVIGILVDDHDQQAVLKAVSSIRDDLRGLKPIYGQ